MKIVNYLRPIWEGADKKPSIRRILALVFTVGIIRMTERSYTLPPYDLNNDILITLCGTVLILLGLITWDNLQSLKQLKSGTDNNNP